MMVGVLTTRTKVRKYKKLNRAASAALFMVLGKRFKGIVQWCVGEVIYVVTHHFLAESKNNIQ